MKRIILVWNIEKYGYCWHERGERLISPAFRTDLLHGTAWTISVWPKGFTDSDFISCFLHRSKDDDGPLIVSVNYDFSANASNSSLATFKSITCEEFTKGAGSGSFKFANRDEFLNRVHRLDVLTIICKLWVDEGDIPQNVLISARTRIGVERISVTPIVEEFSALTTDQKKTLRIVSRPEGRPVMSINIFTTIASSCEEKVIVEITPDGRRQLSAFSCNLHLLDAAGNPIKCGKADTLIKSVTSGVLQVPLLFSKRQLLDKREEYLPEDMLSVHCECAFTKRSEFKEIEIDYCGRHVMKSLLPLVSDDTGCRSLDAGHVEGPCVQDDLKSLYDDRVLSDIKLKTKTETFLTHKTVLAARSSVLRAMLTSDMKEKSEQCIEVEDLEDDTVRQLLLFLYTDAVEDLTLDTAPKLYYAADKYQVQRLVKKCSTFLIANINFSNVSEILLLADMHRDSRLKTAVEDFILKHDGEVFGSEGWMTFMETHPGLAVKTMHLKYKK